MIYNTFGIPATAVRYITVSAKDELLDLLQHDTLLHTKPFFVLGGGSNIIFASHYPGTILHLENKGIHLVQELPQSQEVLVEASAGENWDSFVQHCIANGWHGTENLAAIPGTVGASSEYVDLTLTSVDLKLFFDQYNVDVKQYLGGFKFQSSANVFDKYIDYWTEEKISAGKEGRKGSRQLAKLMLNSLY